MDQTTDKRDGYPSNRTRKPRPRREKREVRRGLTAGVAPLDEHDVPPHTVVLPDPFADADGAESAALVQGEARVFSGKIPD
jgi:hypothetical protein